MGGVIGEKGSEVLRICSSDSSEGPAIAVLDGYGYNMEWDRGGVRWGETSSNPAIDSEGVPTSWWTRRPCRVITSAAWLELCRGMDGRYWMAGPGRMPARRDLTGYTYELEDCEGSPLLGAFMGPSLPSCMTGTWCKRTRRINRRIAAVCIEHRDNGFSFVDLRQISTALDLAVLTEASHWKG